jgi:hypothetical protein
MHVLPKQRITDDVLKVWVVNSQEADLLQVWSVYPPATPKVTIDSVPEDITKCTPSKVYLCGEIRGLLRVLFLAQRKLFLNSKGNLLKCEARSARSYRGRIDRGSQRPDLDEVVQMTRLQAGILTVVSEREQLSRGLRQGVVVAKVVQSADAKGRSRGGPSLQPKDRQLRNVALAGTVAFSATDTKAEWCLQNPSHYPISDSTSRLKHEFLGDMRLFASLQLPLSIPILVPIFRDKPLQFREATIPRNVQIGFRPSLVSY